MRVIKSNDSDVLGRLAAEKTADCLNRVISKNGYARLILSTGASQFDTLKYLVSMPVDWTKVTGFHLDEYIGIDHNHRASFVKYLRERFVDRVPINKFYYVKAYEEPKKLIEYLTEKLRERPIDVALIGIGENCHIAFNDPPCDILTTEAYHIVTLDNRCREQQVGEGWFDTIEEVPSTAISMTVHQILQAEVIISAVPYKVKAEAIYKTLNNNISPDYPSTYLRLHKDWSLYIDNDSASLINNIN